MLSRSTWSGHGSAHNDPAREQQKGIGPLPAGDYDLGPLQAHHGHLGPDVMALTARPGTQTYGRGDFFWHGDHPNDTDWSASDGCMISDHARPHRRQSGNGPRGPRDLSTVPVCAPAPPQPACRATYL